MRYFDTSPWYGLGLCERRFGRFLHDKPRGDYILSTKVGKLLKASPANEAKKYFPFTTSPNDPLFDYSADGVRRSVEDSLQRMGIDRIDMLFVHDLSPDNSLLPADWQTLWRAVARTVTGGILAMVLPMLLGQPLVALFNTRHYPDLKAAWGLKAAENR